MSCLLVDYLSLMRTSIIFPVLSYQRRGFIPEETQDAPAAVHTSSTTRPQQLWIPRHADQTYGHHVSKHVPFHQRAQGVFCH